MKILIRTAQREPSPSLGRIDENTALKLGTIPPIETNLITAIEQGCGNMPRNKTTAASEEVTTTTQPNIEAVERTIEHPIDAGSQVYISTMPGYVGVVKTVTRYPDGYWYTVSLPQVNQVTRAHQKQLALTPFPVKKDE